MFARVTRRGRTYAGRPFRRFALGREDVLPLGDPGVRNGIDQLYGDGDGAMTRDEMREIAGRWRPYRSVATRYVWREYEAD